MINTIKLLGSVILVSALLILAISCSNGADPATGLSGTPDNISGTIYERGTNLGEFKLSLDADTLTASIEPVYRDVNMDVTNYVRITLLSFQWDPIERVWSIDVAMENPSKYDGHGAWAVFRNIGNQKLLNQDGFTFWQVSPDGPTIRVPVVAIGKDNPQRIFPQTSTEFFNVKIHWPWGTNEFNPMYFVIEASYPNPRQEPIVEQLTLAFNPIPEYVTLTAYIKDWQTDPHTPPLDVYVNLTPIGGDWHHQLFDDGMHGDGLPGDDIWGTSFYAMHPDPVILTVNADDWQDYHFENDFLLGDVLPPCQEPRDIIDGSHSGILAPMEKIIMQNSDWADFWAEHTSIVYPPPPLPWVDFGEEMVVILMAGDRNTGGYYLEINCIRYFHDPVNGNRIEVDYTEFIPGYGCIVPQVFTQPYAFAIVTRFDHMATDYIKHDIVYDCL